VNKHGKRWATTYPKLGQRLFRFAIVLNVGQNRLTFLLASVHSPPRQGAKGLI
jgi:hypothetical protein